MHWYFLIIRNPAEILRAPRPPPKARTSGRKSDVRSVNSQDAAAVEDQVEETGNTTTLEDDVEMLRMSDDDNKHRSGTPKDRERSGTPEARQHSGTPEFPPSKTALAEADTEAQPDTDSDVPPDDGQDEADQLVTALTTNGLGPADMARTDSDEGASSNAEPVEPGEPSNALDTGKTTPAPDEGVNTDEARPEPGPVLSEFPREPPDYPAEDFVAYAGCCKMHPVRRQAYRAPL